MNARVECVRPALWMMEPDEFRMLAANLAKAIDHVIGSREEEEFELENFVDALREIRSVRISLESYADQLEKCR